MNPHRIFVYGASGHGKVVLDILLAQRETNFIGFIDDAPELQGRTVLGVPVLGNGSWLYQQTEKDKLIVALCVGDNATRQRWAEKCMDWGSEFAPLVHTQDWVT